MNTPQLRFLTILLSLAFWGLNAALANYVGRTDRLFRVYLVYPSIVAIALFTCEYVRLKAMGIDIVFEWPEWASALFVLVPIIVGVGGLGWTAFIDSQPNNLLVNVLAVIIGTQTAHLIFDI